MNEWLRVCHDEDKRNGEGVVQLITHNAGENYAIDDSNDWNIHGDDNRACRQYKTE
jgi:hypothetical protein